jgi:hypothetical protein
MNEYQQSPEEIAEGIQKALMTQLAKLSSFVSSAQVVAECFSAQITPMFRHVPLEYAQTPSGWVAGANGIRSYHDMCRIYWGWTSYVHPDGVSVDPAHRQASFAVDVHWEWRDSSRGPPWVERVNCKQTYDSDFKITIAEYVTLSGGNTNVLVVGSLNRQLYDSPIAKSSGKSAVCVFLCRTSLSISHLTPSKTETKDDIESLLLISVVR